MKKGILEIAQVALAVAACCIAAHAAPDPAEVFANPPQSAKTGVWWHWMGSSVTKEGIVKDLDWFKESGIGAATIFGIADSCTPWAATIFNSPTAGLVAFTPEWWKLVRFACEEAEKRGIELGVHNCPGYTSTGGPWIPPRLAMRELAFNITNAELQVSTEANHPFPVMAGESREFVRPYTPSRRDDIQTIAVVDGVLVQHLPKGSYVQPAQWEICGLECDKMNPEAVALHMDHIVSDMKRYVGDQIGRGLKFVLLDSYEASICADKRYEWTPAMPEEFKKRRGYDPTPYLPILGGFHVKAAQGGEAEKKFVADYEKTVRELYTDVLFRIMREKLSEAGLEFACEPYGGPLDTKACAAHVDRLMTEFWYVHPGFGADGRPNMDRKVPGRLSWNKWTGPGGARHNVIEAEAFTSGPSRRNPYACAWNETPFLLKACGDSQFYRGVNRMTLHTCPLQPFGDDVLPGRTMGRWGTHFGRTQTWAESGRGWFRYLNRCQALLQWGEPCNINITGNDITPAGTPLTAFARTDGETLVFYVMNHSGHSASMKMGLPEGGYSPEWFDPVTGAATPMQFENGLVPVEMPPCGTGFLVLRKGDRGAPPATVASRYLQKVPKPYAPAAASAGAAVSTPWRVVFGETEKTMEKLEDWTASADPAVKYFSGTAKYKTSFRLAGVGRYRLLSLGDCNGQIAKVSLNGRELATLWCEPYEILLPEGAALDGENTLEIEFTNVWANRLIGDEQEPADCEYAVQPKFDYPGGTFLARFPYWFKDGIASRPSKGRKCFVDWNYFTKDSPLVRSGLVGPVEFFELPE